MYSVRDVNRKGMGCIANHKIKRGTLIEKEEPVLEIPPSLKAKMSNNYVEIAHLQFVIDEFNKMEKNSKEDYLKLSNRLKMLDPNHPNIDEVQKNLLDLSSCFASPLSLHFLFHITLKTASFQQRQSFGYQHKTFSSQVDLSKLPPCSCCRNPGKMHQILVLLYLLESIRFSIF